MNQSLTKPKIFTTEKKYQMKELLQKGISKREISQMLKVPLAAITTFLNYHPDYATHHVPKQKNTAAEIIYATGQNIYKDEAMWINNDVIQFHGRRVLFLKNKPVIKEVKLEYSKKNEATLTLYVHKENIIRNFNQGWIIVCRHNNWKALCPDCKLIINGGK